MRPLFIAAALLVSAVPASAQTDVHALAQRIDKHYNHLTSLRATFVERYNSMGQTREEGGTMLLKKPGRMRWNYADGKLFVLDGKYAVSYRPGDAEAQRLPAKQLDDLRSPLRFLLGHTQLEKELDHLAVSEEKSGTVLTGTPRFQTGAGEQRTQSISITVDSATGTIRGLRLGELGSSTDFRFQSMQENVLAPDTEFRFVPPAGVTVVDGLPPA